MSNILALDIDGVLNDHSKHPGSMYTRILPECIARLNRILSETQCDVVLSSAWRYQILNGATTLKGFEYLLLSHGVVFALGKGLIGCTVADETTPSREEQIARWLLEHDIQPEDFVILDDLRLLFTPPIAERFVQTHYATGLTDADAERVIALMGAVE